MKRSWLKILSIGLLLFFARTLVWAGAGVKVQKVWPEKLVNRQNTEAVITVTLANYADTDQEPRLVCELVTGLEKTEVIFDRKVKVLAGDILDLPVKFNTGNREWGALVRAKILDSQGTTVSEADEVFAITNNIYKLAVCYSFLIQTRAIGVAQLRVIAAQNRNAYCPVTELFDGFHSDWALNQWGPEKEQWLAHGCYEESREAIKAFIDASHEQGTGVVVYNIPLVGGPAGADFAREHPDWLAYTNGRPSYSSLNVEAMDKLRDPKVTPQEVQKLYMGVATYTPVLFTDQAVMDYGADQIIQVSKYYGFDGIRWDGYPQLMPSATVEGGLNISGACNYRGVPMTAGIRDIDQWNTDNLTRMNNRIRKALPDYIFGDNWSPEYGGTCWPEKMAKTFRTAVKDALVIDEDLQTRGQGGSANPANLWETYRQRIIRGADFIRAANGYDSVSTLVPGTPVFNRQMLSIIFAGGAGMGGGILAESANYFRFALRYSEIIFSHSIKRVAGLDKNPILQVKSNQPLWWKEYVYRGTLSDGKKYLFVSLVNPPVKPYLDYNEKEKTLEQTNLEVTVDQLLAGKVTKAYLLSPDIPGNKLDLKFEGDRTKIKVVIPKLLYWDMVVFEI